MLAKVGKWGGSAAVRLPRGIVDQLGIADGTELDIEIVDGKLVATPVAPRYALADLVAVARAMQKPDIVDDTPIGGEWG